jgi:hypothetical protein
MKELPQKFCCYSRAIDVAEDPAVCQAILTTHVLEAVRQKELALSSDWHFEDFKIEVRNLTYYLESGPPPPVCWISGVVVPGPNPS